MVVKELLVDGLVHGMYNNGSAVKVVADRELERAYHHHNWGWMGRTGPYKFDDDPAVVVALLDQLETPFQTITHYLEMIGRHYELRMPEWIDFRAERILFATDPTGQRWQPKARRWLKIKLDANTGKSPVELLRDSENHGKIAGLGILAAMAQHPMMVRQLGASLPAVNITSMIYRGEDNERYVLAARFTNGTVQFDIGPATFGSELYACPEHLFPLSEP